MKQTKGAIGNLLNRYRAVLKKCHLLNIFGSLAVAGMLVLSGTSIVSAETLSFTDGQTHTFTGENLSYNATGRDAIFAQNNPTTLNIGDNSTKNVNIEGAVGILSLAGGHVNILSKNVNIDCIDTTYGAIWAQNNTTNNDNIPIENRSSIFINAENTIINSKRLGIVAMSNGRIEINGNLTVNSDVDAILTRGDAFININKNNDSIVKLIGNVNFSYHEATSRTGIDAVVNINLNGKESFWEGNTYITWDNKPSNDKLEVDQMKLSLKDQAIWRPTQIIDGDNQEYTALNKLQLDNGYVDVQENVAIVVETVSGEGLLNNNGTTTFEDNPDDQALSLRLANNGTMNLANGMNTTLTELAGTGTINNDGSLTLNGDQLGSDSAVLNTAGDVKIEGGTTTFKSVVFKDKSTFDTDDSQSYTPSIEIGTGESSAWLNITETLEGAPTSPDQSVGTITIGNNGVIAYGTYDTEKVAQVVNTNTPSGTYIAGKSLDVSTIESLTIGTQPATTGNKISFGDNSLFIVDSNSLGTNAVFTSDDDVNASVSQSSQMYVVNARADAPVTAFGDGITSTGWNINNVRADSAMLTPKYDAEKDTIVFAAENAADIFPDLDSDIAPTVSTLYAQSLNKVDAPDQGIRFLSRATNERYLGTDKKAAASSIESAARIAFAAAVPQMTKMASDAATNAVVNRLGLANPDNGAKAMNVDGKLVDDKALGLALWIAPLWSNQTGFGMEAGNLDYGYSANIGGISLGADYTWANNIRAGLMFNIGGGYAESSGDLSETTNSMTFWGVGAYGGWKYENFAVMADVSYTSTWNSVNQDVDSRMKMSDLEADIQASAISAGLRFEYKLETQYLDLIPHVGARYMSINTWGYDVDNNEGTVLEGDGFQQNIWTFPVGITFSKEVEMNNDWYFKPAVDFTVIPAAGDIKAKQDVRFGNLPSVEMETQMMDYFTWQGGVGLEFGNENMSVGVNYTLQAGQNSTGHGVFGMFRYEF